MTLVMCRRERQDKLDRGTTLSRRKLASASRRRHWVECRFGATETGKAVASQTNSWMSRIFVTLTMLALAVRFALPAGIMLEKPAEQNDLPALVLCTSTGMVTIKADSYGIPSKTDPARHDGSGKPGEPCVFAAVAVNIPPPAPAVLDQPAPVAAPAPFWAALRQRPSQGLAAPPPPSTGPTVSA
ncbi:hypothetical protein [Iodidimonas sp. SYSU 1G8]|uniref:hypothetical protein n=1 Tax=Iodidimonas sp. SYSU 1G8 TaxID=3133967 RepID=UPI0031FE49F5